MSNRRVPPKGGDPAKRAARRAARKAQGGTTAGPAAQMSHASGPAGRRKAREGERAMEQQRAAVKPDTPVCLRPDKYAKVTRCGKDTREARWSEDRRRVTCPDCNTARR